MAPFSSDYFHTIRDLRIVDHHETIQIDQLHITPYFSLLLEIKNIRGNLFIDERFGQLKQTYNGETISYSGVVQQLNRQEEGLNHIFQKLKIKLPIFKLAVFTHPEIHLHTREEHLYVSNLICRIEHLTSKIKKSSFVKIPKLTFLKKSV